VPLRNQVQLIAYPDRLGQNLKDLDTFLKNYLQDAVGGVHILPIYPSNADAGFSPLTHKEVDPAYGTWDDIESISKDYDLCLDLTLNHISDASPEFQDYLQKGEDSEYAGLFIDVDKMGEISQEDMAKIHIRKEKEPFREVTFADGSHGQVWNTFTENQIDLNYDNTITYKYLQDSMEFLMDRGVNLFRLDAFGYITKKIGTNCFLVEPEVYRRLEWFNQVAQARGAEILPEVHDHPSYQTAIAERHMYAYGFALAPLALYTLLEKDSSYLKNWLRACPSHQITVLDTHDGICIPDVEGIIPEEPLQNLIDNVSYRSTDPIYRKSAAQVHSVGAIYQLTATYFDALKRKEDAYIVARAIQFFAPGIPQVYYVGLLAGENNYELTQQGEARDVNRHFFDWDEIENRMSRSVVQRQLELMRFRNHHPAFNGRFELHSTNDSSLKVSWQSGEYIAKLFVDLNYNKATIHYTEKTTLKEKKWVV
jgi:sucrose phosphorylase